MIEDSSGEGRREDLNVKIHCKGAEHLLLGMIPWTNELSPSERELGRSERRENRGVVMRTSKVPIS